MYIQKYRKRSDQYRRKFTNIFKILNEPEVDAYPIFRIVKKLPEENLKKTGRDWPRPVKFVPFVCNQLAFVRTIKVHKKKC